MKTSHRLEQALTKLYVAFHNNQLHPECCKQCAVGNILDNTDSWKHLTDIHGSEVLNYVGMVNQKLGKTFNGYSPAELLKIESVFLKGCGYGGAINGRNAKPKNPTDKDVLFNGLSEVIKFLCEIDGVSNVMDYTKLFEFENDKPRFQSIIIQA
ncbi:hypothetical protein GCM10007962_21540 [Yeosuana aromativorans]|uniref:Na(+)-translocating NADH-quinone reductase subunit F n=1 Tax=Yeosuana aromativorans TaxID=288019 RepID=A0A8J3BK71_9FLAO|nr:Na(+)-translocating NADH-quinone reductase subunit F [Yeosuana aromativorans]GGK26955.1 hypothetical protein GCM10007962_21540 [Yeosuana aromativorans]